MSASPNNYSSTRLNSTSNIPEIHFNSGTNTSGTNTPRIHSRQSTRLNSPTRHQLLQEQMLTNKPAYKQIRINLKETPLSHPKVSKSVSFDTISKDFLDIGDDDSLYTNDDDDNGDDDIDYDDYEQQNDDDYFSRSNRRTSGPNNRTSRHDPSLANYLSPQIQSSSNRGSSRNRGRSPSPYRDSSPSPALPGFRSLSNIEGGTSKIIYNKNGWRTDYPSRPTIDLDSFTLSYKHLEFDQYIKKKRNYRALIVYITGRRHSWVALDFAIDKCLKNGDHLVVVSRVPSNNYGNEFKNKHKNKNKHKHKQINDQSFKKTAENIKSYLDFLTDDGKICKFTIDLYQHDSTFTILSEVIKIHEPSTIITSTKPNLKFKRSQTWKTARITDRLLKNFSIPIVVVPAFTMNEYEVEFFNRKISEKQMNSNVDLLQDKLREFDLASATIPSISSSRNFSNNENDFNGGDEYSEDYNGTNDTSSIRSDCSGSSNNSSSSDEQSNSSSLQELTRTLTNYQEVLDNYVQETEFKEIKEDDFLKKLNKITDLNHKISLKFTETSNTGGEAAALVRSLTGFTEVVKTKSLLDVLDEPSSTNDDSRIKNLKTALYQNLSNGGGSDSFGSTPGTSTPNKTIKFSNDISNPKNLKLKSLEHLNSSSNPINGIGNDNSNGHGNDDNVLRKYKTHTEETNHGSSYFGSKNLSPTRSQPQNSLTKSLSESKVQTLNDSKKKSGFFSRIFNRSKDKDSKSRRPST